MNTPSGILTPILCSQKYNRKLRASGQFYRPAAASRRKKRRGDRLGGVAACANVNGLEEFPNGEPMMSWASASSLSDVAGPLIERARAQPRGETVR